MERATEILSMLKSFNIRESTSKYYFIQETDKGFVCVEGKPGKGTPSVLKTLATLDKALEWLNWFDTDHPGSYFFISKTNSKKVVNVPNF